MSGEYNKDLNSPTLNHEGLSSLRRKGTLPRELLLPLLAHRAVIHTA